MFNLDEYTTVRERVIEFWKRNPNGRIETEILEWSDKRFIVAARLYRNVEDIKPFSTGLANEVITDRGVNKDFALENGATSAIGIACANANIGIDKHKASREEMQKVVTQRAPKPPVQDLVQAIKAADQETAEQDYWTTPGSVSADGLTANQDDYFRPRTAECLIEGNAVLVLVS